jgi:uncharacterized protein (DUF305 family)
MDLGTHAAASDLTGSRRDTVSIESRDASPAVPSVSHGARNPTNVYTPSMTLTRLTLAALLGPALAACAGSVPPARETPPVSDGAALEALYWARADSARARFTEADAAFVTDMIAHHTQAIVMAELVPSRTTDSAIGTLARRIIHAQQDEIAWMERWLRDRDRLLPDASARSEHQAHLAGMATPEQLAELEGARGSAFDRSFLTLMIQHHRGAIAMVQQLLATDAAAQDPATFKLASDIHVDQTTEIARMELMLAALP